MRNYRRAPTNKLRVLCKSCSSVSTMKRNCFIQIRIFCSIKVPKAVPGIKININTVILGTDLVNELAQTLSKRINTYLDALSKTQILVKKWEFGGSLRRRCCSTKNASVQSRTLFSSKEMRCSAICSKIKSLTIEYFLRSSLQPIKSNGSLRANL